jgi:large subunit ribosomal protein L7Ae
MAKGKAVSKGAKGKDWKSQHGHLFQKSPHNFRIGNDLRAKTNLSRVVKWPRYIRLQRQKSILKKRLKVPPSIHQFSKTLDKNAASNLFRLLSHYRPESKEDKKQRLLESAKAENKNQDLQAGKKPMHIKYGLNHITDLVERKKAKLVVIAHDVDPLELVLWLPALCRKMDVPYCIVKGKARLGHLVYKKTATAVALTEVNKEDQAKLVQLVNSFRTMYTDSAKDRRTWGEGVMGIKAQHTQRAIQKEASKEAAKIEKLK